MSILTYIYAVFLSVLLHAGLILFLSFGVPKPAPEIEVKRPQIVQSRLVQLEAQAPPEPPPKENVIDLTAKKQRQEQERKRAEEKLARIQREKEEKQRQQAQKKREEAKKAEEQKAAEKKRLEEEARLEKEQQEKVRIEEERKAAEERQRIEDFNSVLAAEEAYENERLAQEAAARSREVVTSMSAVIRQQVVQQWSPPPSARRDMVAVLKVTMVPTGRVVQTDIIESSGNAAFDRSVILAVQKAQPFDVVKEVEPALFERMFREFRFRFSPQDLRL